MFERLGIEHVHCLRAFVIDCMSVFGQPTLVSKPALKHMQRISIFGGTKLL